MMNPLPAESWQGYHPVFKSLYLQSQQNPEFAALLNRIHSRNLLHCLIGYTIIYMIINNKFYQVSSPFIY